jgi:hypothetical protein
MENEVMGISLVELDRHGGYYKINSISIANISMFNNVGFF